VVLIAAYKIIPGVVKMINIIGQIKAYDQVDNALAPSFNSPDSRKIKSYPFRKLN
jgi:hypothetical protein